MRDVEFGAEVTAPEVGSKLVSSIFWRRPPRDSSTSSFHADSVSASATLEVTTRAVVVGSEGSAPGETVSTGSGTRFVSYKVPTSAPAKSENTKASLETDWNQPAEPTTVCLIGPV